MDRTLRLALAGDVMLGRLVAEVLPARGYRSPWGDLLPVLHDVDLFLINLECALTANETRWLDPTGRFKPFYFRAGPDAVETLTAARVDFAGLANNHSGDFGVEGLLKTAAVLDRAGVAHAGAGATLAEAREPAVLSAPGLRIGIVAFADHPIEWAATVDGPGLNVTQISTAPEHFEAIAAAIADARTRADLVIFCIHWGPNMRPRPTALFREFAHRVIEAGADVFWGHSAHVVQGIEIWRGKPILYDTGDFVDDYAVDPDLRNDLSGLFLLEVGAAGVEHVEVLPVRISDRQVNRAQGRDRDWFVQRLVGLCAEMGTKIVPSPVRESVSVPIGE